MSSLWSTWTQWNGSNSVVKNDCSMAILLNLTRQRLVRDVRTQTALSSINSVQDIARVMERNGTALATIEPKSTDWLEKHGEF